MFGQDDKGNEDPFAGLKEDGTYHSASSATLPGIPGEGGEPTEVPTQKPVHARVGGAKRRRTRGSRSRWHRPTLLIARVGVPLAIAAVVAVVVASHGSSNRGGGSTPNGGSVTSRSVAVGGTSSGKGSQTSSSSRSKSSSSPATFFQNRHDLQVGLERIQQSAPGSKLLLLRIAAVTLDATTIAPNGAVKQIHLAAQGSFVTAGGSTGGHGLRFSSIHPAVAAKLVGEMYRRFHVPASQISYMVVMWPPLISPFWGVFLTNGHDYLATLNGSGLHRSS